MIDRRNRPHYRCSVGHVHVFVLLTRQTRPADPAVPPQLVDTSTTGCRLVWT
jgi:hypothetical protein